MKSHHYMANLDPIERIGIPPAPVRVGRWHLKSTTRIVAAIGPEATKEKQRLAMARIDPHTRGRTPRSRCSQGFLGLVRGAGGQGLVELILALPVFTILFFGIYEFSRYYSTRLRIRTAVAEATRFAATGNSLADDDTGDPLSRAQSIRTAILRNTSHFGVTSGDISLNPPDGGRPEEIVTVSLDYEYEVAIPVMKKVLGTGVLDFSVATSMRNEPFYP